MLKIIMYEGSEAENYLKSVLREVVQDVVIEQLHSSGIELEKETATENANDDPWVDGHEAKKILKVNSRWKMQKIRNDSPRNGVIISQHGRTFLYDRNSLHRYLEKHKHR